MDRSDTNLIARVHRCSVVTDTPNAPESSARPRWRPAGANTRRLQLEPDGTGRRRSHGLQLVGIGSIPSPSVSHHAANCEPLSLH
jgi:hypothetical protein